MTKVPAMVMWYFPIIPRLKRLFRNKENAKFLMTWHKSDRKQDHMLRHPQMGLNGEKLIENTKILLGKQET
jgi:hypothetical protein